MTRADHFRAWLHEETPGPNGPKTRRERLSVSRWAEEVGLARPNMNRFLNGGSLSDSHLFNLITIAEGFGYVPMDNEHHFL